MRWKLAGTWAAFSRSTEIVFVDIPFPAGVFHKMKRLLDELISQLTELFFVNNPKSTSVIPITHQFLKYKHLLVFRDSNLSFVFWIVCCRKGAT